ncbi:MULTISPECIES: sigma-54 dependent transcriptional regulator [unclassified Neptuniibacter]|jgi:DNA-binding NtrC family response regulator|uniref:sigma-54-dependent transcriptional regulator n=1 Tax=unclassified Neptuniibacter TaxID=2630693 RepID=UPI0026E2A58C|nr:MULTISPECIES: sigma-54 dependent transcriptional regulator [unclassified Neptuniibacter]MDO6513920.1 sigma-54 dependent transcriptional regulator [Neptuniibacter sp. 2_MG-2023]MDO6593121.1 sigma-54 dependent transcriptional regulator [Neptuniibacter sp. 1_MG-2023]
MNKAISVLVIDDERNLVRSISFSLRDEGMLVSGAYTGNEGIEQAKILNPDVVLLDLGLPDISGIKVLVQLRAQNPDLPVIMISAHGDTRSAVKAVKEGAIDYITKPFDIEELILLIRRSTERIRMLREIRFLREKSTETGPLVGSSREMTALRDAIERVGQSSGKTVLITGPSGTGKALVARALHDVRFTDAPFIEVNCAALPEQLIEAELFGAERGAYTGANQRRAGLIDLADGGTLFLDEIGEIPLHLQAKLLSFLENRNYRPVGAGRERQANVFVVAATNCNLKANVEAGTFRADLFYRLNVLPVDIPGLSERDRDVTLLVAHFSELFARQEHCEPIELDDEVLSVLEKYDWPGNIRELKNLMERLTILYSGQRITVKMLPAEFDEGSRIAPVVKDDYREAVEDHERQLILDALKESDWRKGLAAEKLGISRHALKRRIQRLNLENGE